MDVKEFKKIDAHAHIGEFGGWAKLSINAEQLIAQNLISKKHCFALNRMKSVWMQ